GIPVAPASPRNSNDENPAPELPFDLGANPESPASAATPESGGGASPWPVILAFLSAGALIALIGVLGQLAWEYPVRGLSRPAQLWEKAVRLSALTRTTPQPQETPREFASRLTGTVPGADA